MLGSGGPETVQSTNHKPILTTTDLHKRFGRTRAVDGVTLEVLPGETLCVVGPNGAGKSTLLLLMGGVILPSSGHATVFGLDRWRDNFEIRKRCTFLTAEPIFGTALTPYEFLRFYAQIYGIPKGAFLERMDTLASGLDMQPHLKKPWDFLSTGMIKKAGLIAAFLPDAKLRILDEPFAGGIDPLAMEFLFQRFRESCDTGEAIVFSTQVLEQAEAVADRMLLIDNGRIAALGTPAELFRLADIAPDSPRAFYRMFTALTKRELT